MLGEIDLKKKPIKPQLFIAKPNREIIGKVSEAFGVQNSIKLVSVSELRFNVPYRIEVNHRLVDNPNIDKIKEKYLIKAVKGNHHEWYVITELVDQMEEDQDVLLVVAKSLPYQLKDKMIRSYQVESYYATQVLNDVLQGTNWSVGYIDADFDVTYRAFNFAKNTVLDCVFKIAETYNAIIDWDTENRTINFIKPELHGLNRGLKFNYGHYLRTMNKTSNADEMVTCFIPTGKDGLTINRVNPTGQGEILDFSFFMYPFERDENKNVLKHSYYMTDSLCHALLDHSDLVEEHRGEFNDLLSQLETLQAELGELNIELYQLENDAAQITDIMIAQQFNEDMWFYKFDYEGNRVFETTVLDPNKAYAVLCKVSSTNNLTVMLDGIQRNVKANEWVMLGKTTLSNFTTVEVNGSAKDVEVFIQVAYITNEEYQETLNEEKIIEKYSLDNKEMQINAKKAEIAEVESDIEDVESQIKQLRDLLSLENNFTPEQIEEMNEYVIVKEFSDQNYIDDHELYKDALEKFKELQKPQLSVTIDIVNFLEIIEEQHNWDKLILGDEVIIEYDVMNIEVSAKIIEINYDYEEANISLTIANVKELDDDSKKINDYLKGAIETSTTVNLEKNKWTKAVVDSSEMSRLFDNFWNKVTNEINMASNETVVIDRKGLTIYDPDDPLRFLRATHGALALTRSGGLRYETAITADGIIAERLFGKILLTQRVVIGDDDGILEIHGAKATITDRCDREVMKFGLFDEEPDKFGIVLNRYKNPDDCDDTTIINQVIVDRDEGFKITRRDGTGWGTVAWLDMDGFFNGRGVKIDYIEGTLTNGIIINPEDGIVVTRADGLVRTRLNATDGISIEHLNGAVWQKKFYADINGQFYSEDLIAKRLRIVSDLDDILLDADTSYLNIGWFTTIITDGKLTPIEKLTVKEQWETIQTEYQKLLYQAQLYEYSDRDDRTVSHIDIPPFTSAFQALGNYLAPLLANMNETTPVDREEFTQKFQDYYDEAKRIINEITDALKYSSVQFGVDYNKVTIDAINGILIERGNGMNKIELNATEGFSIYKWENGSFVRKLYADLDGTLVAEDLQAYRLQIFGSKGDVIIDGSQDYIDFGNFDAEGIARLAADLIASKMVVANDAYINDLTVNRLKTLSDDIPIGSYVDHVDIRDNVATWISARVGDRVQVKDAQDRPLYFTDSSKRLVTTENTGIPFYEYVFNEELNKAKFGFMGSGHESFPYIVLGLGTGSGSDDDFSGRGKGYIYKDSDEFVFKYNVRMTNYVSQIKLFDDGVVITAENSLFSAYGNNALIKSEGGTLKLEHSSGNYIEITSSGININSVGNVTINGSRIDLNT